MGFADLTRARSFVSCLTTVSIFAVAFPLMAQDPNFDWSWEKDNAEGDAKKAPEKAPKEGEEGFKWSWGEGGADPAQGAKDTTGSKDAARIRDDQAYQKLLKENLDLRRKIAEALKDEQLAKKESARLTSEIVAMEKSLADSVQVITALKRSQVSSMNPEQVNDLEVKLADAEKARDLLSAELDRLKKVSAMNADKAGSSTAKVTQQSDLFQEREKENMLLKKRLGEIESERRRLAKEREELASEAEKAKQALAKVNEKALAAARQGAQYKKIVDKLPNIEEQVSSLKTDVALKDEKLSLREQQLEALKVELDRREHRLAKAQKMAALLEKARSEIQQVNDKEKLDMHYNMAVIYAKEGRSRESEVEYLRALRIDPTDADIHYNLAILYDQDLKKASKAVMHYRRYLNLRPNASDSDQVRSWIMELEMSN